MLTSLLNALQGALTNFTRGFLVVGLLPVVLFTGANVAILHGMSPALVNYYIGRISGDAFLGVLAFAALFGVALLLTSLQPLLLQVLEGDALPAWIRHPLLRDKVDTLDELKRRAERAYMSQRQLDKMAEDRVPRVGWMIRLADIDAGGSAPSQATVQQLAALWEERRRGELIDADAIEDVVAEVQRNLSVAGAHSVPESLMTARNQLRRIIGYARDRSRQEYLSIQNVLQSTFPGDVFDPNPSSDNVVAPTMFGNIGRTMRSYALRRYSIDLDIFWTRFQKVMSDSTSSKMVDALQTQKSQVDFLVTMFWLSILTGVIWIPWLAVDRAHPWLFRAVTLGVPAAAWMLYHAACHAYVLFTDQVRTAVDYFRFDVLRGFHLPDPPGTKEEEQLWERLGGRVGYANPRDTFVYVRQQQS